MKTPRSQKAQTTTARRICYGSKDIARQPVAGIALEVFIDEDAVNKLLRQSHGNVARTADAIGCTRNTLRRYIDRHPNVAEVLTEARERVLDELEESVFDRAINGDNLLSMFLLKTQGKSRGYAQSEAQDAARDIATAAFEFIVSKTQAAQPQQLTHSDDDMSHVVTPE